MGEDVDRDGAEAWRQPPAPAGGVRPSEERLQLLAPQWRFVRQQLRRMDELSLGETEPATSFVWEAERQ